MLGCYGVKFRCGWNWQKIEIWDLQALYNNAMYLVFLDPVSPYPKIVQRNRVRLSSLSNFGRFHAIYWMCVWPHFLASLLTLQTDLDYCEV